ncbi:hypothetical protein EXIGLDRAFT_680177 [Exidia glandulosa HHB12029]|uniref:Uncharacterized protein n=1 Tax=Exidia glandulosa HHB12029 TaxID=1314781 RepID=A0A165EL15_EXIGL|nr:hypothetical protein EXIGLDRAFT_680177 [Exidia glandulosa HHB12029]
MDLPPAYNTLDARPPPFEDDSSPDARDDGHYCSCDDPSCSLSHERTSSSRAASAPSTGGSRTSAVPSTNENDIPPLNHDPNASLPDTFPVGGRQTRPVISVQELLAHLRILRAFSALRDSVEKATQIESYVDATAAWTIFLSRAVYRFEKWIATLAVYPEGALPPLDVLMVWHSFLLNPMIYKEDSTRIPQLATLTSFPLLSIAAAIDAHTNTLDADPPRMRELFETCTGESYDPPVVTQETDTVRLTCPKCDAVAVTFAWPWIKRDATGWAQRNFSGHCAQCNQDANHEAHGVRRFFDDVIAWRDSQKQASARDKVFLAGTLRQYGPEKGQLLIQKILNRQPASHLIAKATACTLGASVNWKLASAARWCSRSFTPAGQPVRVPRMVSFVLSHYRFPGSFSIELSGAVMRQASFIRNILAVEWANPDLSGQHPSPLIRSVARYHAFLDLISARPDLYAVPTLDIDLSWHTHQLKGVAYHTQTKFLVGRTPDHNDRVEENMLSDSFDQTAIAWLERYGVPYSLCGCVVPTETRSVSQMLHRLSKLLPGQSSSQKGRNEGSTELGTPHCELVSTQESDAQATHPSDHNAVVIARSSKASNQRKERESEQAKQLKTRQKEVSKGRADPWKALQERNAAATSTHGESGTSGHDAAFFRLLSYCDDNQCIYGPFGYAGATCGVNSGGALTWTCTTTTSSAACAVGSGNAVCAVGIPGGAVGGCATAATARGDASQCGDLGASFGF